LGTTRAREIPDEINLLEAVIEILNGISSAILQRVFRIPRDNHREVGNQFFNPESRCFIWHFFILAQLLLYFAGKLYRLLGLTLVVQRMKSIHLNFSCADNRIYVPSQ
jgi:hypothetical protein